MPSKISKKSSASTSSGNLHPKGRKFKQLNRASLRTEKLARDNAKRNTARNVKLFRFTFFQQAVKLDQMNTNTDSATATPYTLPQVRDIIQAYLSSDIKELEKLKKERRPDRPASSKQDQLQIKVDQILNEYGTSGLVVPDLTDVGNIERLLNWKGDLGGITNINTMTVTEN